MSGHHYSPVDDDELPGSFRHRQRTLQRWRVSMLGAFLSGVVVTMLVYPRVLPCRACAPCGTTANIGAVVDDAVKRAVAQCPTCPSCPECPHLNSKECPPAPACPSCALTCPELQGASGPSDDEVVARHRERMLSRPMVNILECKPGQVCRADSLNRSRVIGQKGITLWMTGLSGSGKTTIAEALEKRLLYALGKNVFRIDGDNLRTGLTRDLGFSPDDRTESVRRASQVAALFSEAGIITMVTLISPYRKDRDAAREMHAVQGIPFMEVFMDVPLSVVQARDPKGLYKKVSLGGPNPPLGPLPGPPAHREAPAHPEPPFTPAGSAAAPPATAPGLGHGAPSHHHTLVSQPPLAPPPSGRPHPSPPSCRWPRARSRTSPASTLRTRHPSRPSS